MPFERVAALIVRPQVLAGMDRMQPEIRTLVNEVLQRFGEGNEPPLAVAEEGAALALWGHQSIDAFLEWHREIGGLARVLDVALAATAYHRRTYEWDNSIWALARARPAVGLSNLGPLPWMWLRRELEASPGERAAVREIAAKARAWHTRCAMAYLIPDLWSAADEAELRQVDLDDWHSVWIGLLAAMRGKAIESSLFQRPYDLINQVTPGLIAERLTGEPAVAALRLIQAMDALAAFEHPDALRALAELADLSASWKPLAQVAPTSRSIDALAPMFTTRRPRRARGLQLAKGLFYELVAAAPDEAAKVESAFVATALDETGVRAPADDGWVSPWIKPKTKQPKKAAPKSVDAERVMPAIPFEETIHWADGQREELAGWRAELRGQKDEEHAQKCIHEGKVGKSFVLYLTWMSDEPALRTWKAIEPKKWYAQTDDIEHLLARFGLAELDSLIAFVLSKPDTLPALSRVESPRVAQVMARGFALVKKQRDIGKTWLDEFPEAAAIGLVTAVPRDRKQRDANVQALAHVTARHPKIVEGVLAKPGGTIAPAEIAEAAAPTLPARVPKLPGFVDLERLPRPLTRDGTALQGDGLAEFVQVLKAGLLEGNPIIDQLAQRYTPDSLARLAWGLFRQWLYAEGPPKDKWAHHALGKFPDDDNARALGRLARYWAPSGNPTRAQDAVEVLAAMRTQQGLIEIHEIATHVQSKALRARAETVFETVAESLGIGTTELADRLIPELSADDLAFGDLHVELDVHLVPHLVGPDGARRDKSDPDDAARFKELKKTCAAVARGQLARLEQAMAEAHRMPFAHFAEIYLMHSLIRHLARGLVWGAYRDATLAFAFSIAQDGPIDRAGAPLELPIDARYGVIHPAELAEPDRAAWTARIGEQPFEQLARTVYPTTSTAAVQVALLSLIGKDVRTANLLELQRRGWRRGDSPQGGQYYSIDRSGTGWRAELAFLPGIYLGSPTEQLTQNIEAIAFDAEPGTPIAVLSEIQRDLARLR